MEATLVGAVVGATVQVGLQNVLTSIQEIISMARHYEEYLKELKISLEMVQGFLSYAEANKVSSEVFIKFWLNQLEDVAFEANHVLDEVKYKLLRRQVKNQESKKVLGFRKFMFKVEMSREIKDVLSKLKKINKEAKGYGLQYTIAAASQTRTFGLITPAERETGSFSIEPNVEGRVTDVDNIVEMLITAPQEDKISVIPILGMGGVGKTTVAGTVFNHEKIKNHFGKRIWLSVSLDFDAVSLFSMILQDLTKEDVKVSRNEVVLQKIQDFLMNEKDKPYLLILDDVWNEENDKWDDEFMVPLSKISNNLFNGNCIVVTTRKENVASLVKTLPTHQLRCLSAIQCWSIIKAKTFRGKDVPEEFETIGMHIAKRCDGLPLAAKVIGGLLRGKPEEYWSNILENKLFDGDGDKIMKILRLSYDNLPTLSLKKCFAYCSIFPQDYPIKRQEIVELWMAEGFLQVGQGDDMETAGIEVFNRLLQYSLFQDAYRDNFGDIVGCMMHDLVHELACLITKDMHQVRYLAFKSAGTNEPNSISQMKYLRTMFFEGIIANHMFSNFSCLYVLKLKGKEIKELPSEIEKLIHLRYLDILSTEIDCLPDSIGKLYHLHTLLTDQTPYTNLKKLPNTIINLVSLRHLHISADTQLPPGIGNLTSLRTLQNYKVRDENSCRIDELGKLKNLKGELEIENLEMVKDKEEAELADLYGKPGIFKLVLKWNKSRDGVGHHENVLDGLQPHPRLKSLEIVGYNGENLPSWMMRMATRKNIDGQWEAFNNLVEIKLEGSTHCEELPTLGHLRRLRFLLLNIFTHVRSIGNSFYGHENSGTPETAFPALERLELQNMPELTEWLAMEGATTNFPCLKYLVINFCPKLKSVHSHLTCLERFEVHDADFSLTNLLSNTSSLQYIKIESLPGLDSLPGELFMKNQNLTYLKIDHCPKLISIVPGSLCGSLKELHISYCKNLKELPDDLNTLCNIEDLWFMGCPRLKSIPYDARGQSLKSIRELNIRGCQGLTDLPVELLESCTSSLQSLNLDGLDNLENLDTLIPCLGRMSRLSQLTVTNIPKLMKFPTVIGCLTRLVILGIGGFSESINAASFNDELARIFSECRSLNYLILHGQEHWHSLPDSIQKIAALRILYINDFGIESIPEWIGNFASLEYLETRYCKRLRYLPSMEARKKLTKFNEFKSIGSPLLTESWSRPSSRVPFWDAHGFAS